MPMQVNKTDSSYEEVSSSHSHTCALDIDGQLECWGDAQRAEIVPDGFLVA